MIMIKLLQIYMNKNNEKPNLYFRQNISNHRIFQKRRNINHILSLSSSAAKAHSISIPKLQNIRKTPILTQAPKPKRKESDSFSEISSIRFPNKNKHMEDNSNQSMKSKQSKKIYFHKVSQSINSRDLLYLMKAMELDTGTQNDSQISDCPSNIKEQPEKSIFLCKNCYEYFQSEQIKVHNKNCNFKGTQNEFREKWIRLAKLLQVASAEKCEGELRVFSQYMQKYGITGYNRLENQLLKLQTRIFNAIELQWVIKSLATNYSRNQQKLKNRKYFNFDFLYL